MLFLHLPNFRSNLWALNAKRLNLNPLSLLMESRLFAFGFSSVSIPGRQLNPCAGLLGQQSASVSDGPRLFRLFLPVSAPQAALLRSPGDLVVSPD